MQSKEPYLHARNYGCRVRRYTVDGITMLSMENSRIKVAFAVGKGADIVEFLYKPQDVDFLWHSFNTLADISRTQSVSPSGGSFLDNYTGGWQELFPTYGGKALYRGGEIGVHGEASILPWEYSIDEDTPERISVTFSLRTARSPFLLRRTVILEEDSTRLQLKQQVTNLSSTEQRFMWGHHPAFGYPFLDDSVELRLPGSSEVFVPQAAIYGRCPFDKETSGTWPIIPDKDGQPFDMSKAHDSAERICYEYAVRGLQTGEYTLVNQNRQLGIKMSWDLTVFKYLWVWCMFCGHEDYPWYGRAYTMAVEPWSSLPASFPEADSKGDVLTIGPRESREAWLDAEIVITK